MTEAKVPRLGCITGCNEKRMSGSVWTWKANRSVFGRRVADYAEEKRGILFMNFMNRPQRKKSLYCFLMIEYLFRIFPQFLPVLVKKKKRE